MKDAKKWLPGAIISIGLIAAILYFVDLPKWWTRSATRTTSTSASR